MEAASFPPRARRPAEGGGREGWEGRKGKVRCDFSATIRRRGKERKGNDDGGG